MLPRSHSPSSYITPLINVTNCIYYFLYLPVDYERKSQLKRPEASRCSNWTLLEPNIPRQLKLLLRKPAGAYDWKMEVQLGLEMMNTNRNGEEMTKENKSGST